MERGGGGGGVVEKNCKLCLLLDGSLAGRGGDQMSSHCLALLELILLVISERRKDPVG